MFIAGETYIMRNDLKFVFSKEIDESLVVLKNQNRNYFFEQFSSFNKKSKTKIDKIYDNRIQKLKY